MATIQGQAGVNLSQELATYLSENQGNYTSEQLSTIINQYLSGGDKLGSTGGQITNGIYKRFGEFDQITGKVEVVTTGLWSGDTGSLTSFFTSSAQVSATSGKYYYNVYNTADTSSVQFSIAYGNRTGLGSPALSGDDTSTLETKATYAQYKQILLEQDDSQFTFLSSSAAGTHDSDAIYVINVARARYKEKMDAGNWSLTLLGSNSYPTTLIDDSGKKFDDTVGKAGRVFNIVTGSLNLGTENDATVSSSTAPNGEGFGLFYPDQGLIVLNPSALASEVGTIHGSSLNGSILTNASAKNQQYLFDSIVLGNDFEARRTENVSTSHYFVRATNREFNFSNNPSFTTGSAGSFTESTFETNPQTFITTVGLLNDANEMIAVAKTSQPIPKSFDKEVLIKVKLDF
tara:strand:- start:2050 stop:3258 length:1209 start_codon:yes stop_codon:yes gene_type:complete